MAKKNLINLAILIGVVGLAWYIFSGNTLSVAGGGGAGDTPGSTQNPSLELSCLDGKTLTADNECTIRVLQNGNLIKSSTTASGVVSITALSPLTTYTLEVVQPGSATAFYPFSSTITTNKAGPVTKALFYTSVQNTAPSPVVYNFNGITDNSTAQAIGANESGTFRIRFRTAASTNDNNKFRGPALFVVDANNNSYTNGISMKNPDGTTMAVSSSPTGHSVVDANRTTSYAFLSNIQQFEPSTDYDTYITVKSGTNNPANTLDHNSGLRIMVYDQSRYLTKAGVYKDAYRNEDNGTDIGAANWTASINVT